MFVLYHQRRKSRFLFILGFFFVVLLFFPRPVNAAKACAETGCAEYGCNSGLTCNSGSDTCGITYNSCSGATCIQDNNWDITSPCDTADLCTPAGTTRTAAWSGYGSCSATCGNGTQTSTCTCGTQNNCLAECVRPPSPTTSPMGPTTIPVAGCGETDSLACCVDQTPQVKPVIMSVGTGSCNRNDPMTVNWSFSDTGSTCGKSWGYKCGGNTNTFLIKVDGVTNTLGINSTLRTYDITTSVAVSHQIQVCAENGYGENCSTSYSVTVDNTAPPIPVPIVEYVSEGASCPGKYKLKYSWNAVSDNGCAGIDTSAPYWSQISSSNAFPDNLFPINGWGNYVTQTTNTSALGGTVLYAHVQSRDALDNQSGWSTPPTSITVPTPTLYPAIHINGPLTGAYQERIVDGGSVTCSSMNVNSSSLILQASVPSYVTSSCTKTDTTYSCDFVINNQTAANACVSNSITIGMSGTYAGYTDVGWRAGESCSGASSSTFTLTAGSTKSNIPLFFTYDATGSEGWFKLSNASFTNRLATVRHNFIPYNILSFDGTTDDDISTHNFSIKNAGIVSQQTPLNVGASSVDVNGNPVYSTTNIYTSGYTTINDVDYQKYVQYVKSRKGFVTKALLSEITSDGVYLITSPVTVDATSSALLSNEKVVLFTEGSNVITIAGDFNPTSASIAFVAPTITIDSSVKRIDAVLIAGTVQTGESANELKINGNVVAQNSIALQRKRSSPQRPSFFVNFMIKTYIDLLPYLSVSTYDWKQIQ